MTEHKHPDDGGPAVMFMNSSAVEYDRDRFEAARQFAAAWLPLLTLTEGPVALYQRSNELGLAMADDLIRRLREST